MLIYVPDHYNPSVRIMIDLLTPLLSYVLYFISKWRDLKFKVNTERQIFEEIFIANLFTLRVFATNLLRGNRVEIFFNILLSPRSLTRCLNHGLTSDKLAQYLIDYRAHINTGRNKFLYKYTKCNTLSSVLIVSTSTKLLSDRLAPRSWENRLWEHLGFRISYCLLLIKL